MAGEPFCTGVRYSCLRPNSCIDLLKPIPRLPVEQPFCFLVGEDAQGRVFLKARVSVPPVDGEANAALEKLLAKALGLPRAAVNITGGQTARIKQVTITGLDAAEVAGRLNARR